MVLSKVSRFGDEFCFEVGLIFDYRIDFELGFDALLLDLEFKVCV